MDELGIQLIGEVATNLRVSFEQFTLFFWPTVETHDSFDPNVKLAIIDETNFHVRVGLKLEEFAGTVVR